MTNCSAIQSCLRNTRRKPFRGWTIFIFLLLAGTLWIIYPQTSIFHMERDEPLSYSEVDQDATEHHFPVKKSPEQLNSWDTVYYVKGDPTDRFQDNLLNDASYVTTWANGGFTNEFIGLINMIYLGILTDRIPIIPPFTPDHHISQSAGQLPFGEIFNLTRFRQHLRKPILEWSDLKILPPRASLERPSTVEEIGCWSTRSLRAQIEPVQAHNLLHYLGLEVSYTKLPPYVHVPESLANELHVGLIPLAQKIYPQSPIKHFEDDTIMAPTHDGVEIAPGHQVSCFDSMYFTAVGSHPYEWKSPWSPVWRFVGRYLHFTDSVLDLAKQYARKALHVTSDELPPFITVHARRGDFANNCWDVPGQCLAPVSAFVRKAEEIREALFLKTHIQVTEVIMTSDEQDPAFWKEVEEVGWKRIDHTAEQTLELYGEWYPPIVDIAIQSLSLGFVGSVESTMSALSAHRVEEWNGGITRMVKWGGRE